MSKSKHQLTSETPIIPVSFLLYFIFLLTYIFIYLFYYLMKKEEEKVQNYIIDFEKKKIFLGGCCYFFFSFFLLISRFQLLEHKQAQKHQFTLFNFVKLEKTTAKWMQHLYIPTMMSAFCCCSIQSFVLFQLKKLK